MKIGSIVMCISRPYGHSNFTRVTWIPEVRKIYHVREIQETDGLIFLLFEEGVIGIKPNGEEFGMLKNHFREIEFPPSLTEEIQECLTRELEPVKINQ